MDKVDVELCPETGICSIVRAGGTKTDLMPDEVQALRESGNDLAKIREVVAGADGVVMSIKEIREDAYLKADAVRVSIFLSLLDVHINRAPIAGNIAFLGYFPGARFFTFDEKSSEFNQHNSILIEGPQTRCLVNQIVGPVARRVVYWLKLNQVVQKGDRIGMMKFGSRLDMVFPKADVNVVVKPGDRVQAGLTVVATMKQKP